MKNRRRLLSKTLLSATLFTLGCSSYQTDRVYKCGDASDELVLMGFDPASYDGVAFTAEEAQRTLGLLSWVLEDPDERQHYLEAGQPTGDPDLGLAQEAGAADALVYELSGRDLCQVEEVGTALYYWSTAAGYRTTEVEAYESAAAALQMLRRLGNQWSVAQDGPGELGDRLQQLLVPIATGDGDVAVGEAELLLESAQHMSLEELDAILPSDAACNMVLCRNQADQLDERCEHIDEFEDLDAARSELCGAGSGAYVEATWGTVEGYLRGDAPDYPGQLAAALERLAGVAQVGPARLTTLAQNVPDWALLQESSACPAIDFASGFDDADRILVDGVELTRAEAELLIGTDDAPGMLNVSPDELIANGVNVLDESYIAALYKNAVVNLRHMNGRICDMETLARIPRVGPKTLEALRQFTVTWEAREGGRDLAELTDLRFLEDSGGERIPLTRLQAEELMRIANSELSDDQIRSIDAGHLSRDSGMVAAIRADLRAVPTESLEGEDWHLALEQAIAGSQVLTAQSVDVLLGFAADFRRLERRGAPLQAAPEAEIMLGEDQRRLFTTRRRKVRKPRTGSP